MLFLSLAQLTDEIDPMYIIPKVLSEPHNDAHVIFFVCFQFRPPDAPKTVFLGSSTAHRQDGPHLYYTKMTVYLDIHEAFFISDI